MPIIKITVEYGDSGNSVEKEMELAALHPDRRAEIAPLFEVAATELAKRLGAYNPFHEEAPAGIVRTVAVPARPSAT